MATSFKNLSDRLKFALQLRGMSQSEAARRINVTPQVVQYLCSSSSTKSKFTPLLAEALGIDLAWLAAGIGTAPSDTPADHHIPVLTFAQLKQSRIDQLTLDPLTITNQLVLHHKNDSASFGVTLTDKAMAPKFDIGTLIIIDPTVTPSPANPYVLVYVAAEDFFVFRQLMPDQALVPLNTTLHKTITLQSVDRIMGVCKEARWNT